MTTGKFRTAMTAMTLSLLLLSSCAEPGQDNAVGLQLWSVRDAMGNDPESTIKQIGEMGYDYVESAGYNDGLIYGMEPETFKNLVEENGMRYLGAHVGRQIPEDQDWKELMPWWDTCIAAHQAAGVEYIVQPSMGHTAFESLEGLAEYCEYFNAIGAKCQEAGIRFGFHNHAGEFSELEGEIMYDYMMQKTDADKVMFQLDVYWIKEGGKDFRDYLEKYPGRYGSIHIKDEKELGESGEMNFEQILDLAQKKGVDYYVVEVEKYNYSPLESVDKSLDHLREIGFTR